MLLKPFDLPMFFFVTNTGVFCWENIFSFVTKFRFRLFCMQTECILECSSNIFQCEQKAGHRYRFIIPGGCIHLLSTRNVHVVRVSKNAHLFCNLNIFSCFSMLLIITKQNKTKVYCWVIQLENMWCILHIWCRYILLLHTVCTWKSRLHSFIHHLLIFQWDFRSLKWLNKTMNFHFE